MFSCTSTVPIEPVADTLSKFSVGCSSTSFTIPVALTPVKVVLIFTSTIPIEPVAETLTNASVGCISDVPIAVVPTTPDTAIIGVTLPYRAVPYVPVPYSASFAPYVAILSYPYNSITCISCRK